MGYPVADNIVFINWFWLIRWLSDWWRPWLAHNLTSYGATLCCTTTILWPSSRMSDSEEWRPSYGYRCATRTISKRHVFSCIVFPCWESELQFMVRIFNPPKPAAPKAAMGPPRAHPVPTPKRWWAYAHRTKVALHISFFKNFYSLMNLKAYTQRPCLWYRAFSHRENPTFKIWQRMRFVVFSVLMAKAIRKFKCLQ
jgi:hypothetical protein